MQSNRVSVADFATASSILFGFSSIIMADDSLLLSAVLILCAVLLDGLDGYLARRYSSSEDGLIFDTLADVVSSTVAPSVLIFYGLSSGYSNIVPGLIAGLFILSGIVHLRRFVRERKTIGCQTTVASVLIAIGVGFQSGAVIIFVTLLSSALMLRDKEYPSNIPINAKLTGGLLVVTVAIAIYTTTFVIPLLSSIGLVILSFMLLSPYVEYFDE